LTHLSLSDKNAPQTVWEDAEVSGVDQAKLLAVGRSVIEADARAVRATLDALDDGFLEVARLLATTSGKTLVTGSGTSGNIAGRAAHLLSVCGTPPFYLSPADGLHGGLGALQPDDLVIALSKGGGSDELNEFCRRAKTLCRLVIVITAAPKSALAAVDHIVALPLDENADLGGVVATGSSLATAAVLDALCEMGRVSRSYDWERLLYTHPSGVVGRNAERRLERLSRSGPKQ
jgi:D-arabinose 5-phosphate isomerase GutQ